MIRDLSETLRAILDDPGLTMPFPELSSARIVFDRPVEAFNPAETTVDLFLFDVRENMELRSNQPEHVRADGGISIRRPPLRVACSYLVTAWPVSGADIPLQEHRLLSQTLQVLARYPKIPPSFLKGKLVGQEPPLPMITARADGLKDPHEFWAAIGNKMRTSIVVTATIGMDVFPTVAAREVVVARTRVGVRSSPGTEGLIPATKQEFFHIGGRVTLTPGGAPVPLAKVELMEPNLAARTDADGRYRLGSILAGTYTVRVTKNATVKTVSVVVPGESDDEYNVQI